MFARVFLIAFFGLAAAPALLAQEPETLEEATQAPLEETDSEADEQDFQITEAGGRLVVESVTVTSKAPGFRTESTSVATKSNTPLLLVPLNVSVTGREQLDDMQVINIGKSHDYSTGFTTTSYNGLAMSRGFSVSWYDHRRDGLRTFSWSIREPVGLDRIQYLRGPAGVLYGDGSPGGLVNLVVKKPLPVAMYHAGVQGGNLGYQRITGDATGPLTADERVQYRVVSAWESLDNSNDNDERRFSILPSLSIRIGDSTTLSLDAEFYSEDARGAGQALPPTPDMLAGDLSGAPFGFNAANPDDKWSNWNASPGIRVDSVLGRRSSVHSAFRYTKIVSDNDYHVPFGLFPDNRTVLRFIVRGGTDWREYQSDTFFTYDYDSDSVDHRLVGGFEVGYSTTDGESGFGPAAPVDLFNPVYSPAPENTLFSFASDSDTRRYGAYVQDQVSFGRLHLLGSLRWSRVRIRNSLAGTESDEEAYSPRVGVVYQLSDRYSVYASFTDGFEPPGAGIILEDGRPADATRSDSYEVGFKANLLDSRLTLTAAAYDLRRTNILEFRQDTGLYRQIGEGTSEGFEIDLVGSLTQNLEIRTGYANNRTEITRDTDGFTGNEFLNAPRHNFSLWGTYNFRQGRLAGLALKAGGVYVSERFADSANQTQVPSYIRYDAGVAYALQNGLVLDLSVDNLTDIDYIQSGSETAWNYGNKRRVSLSVRKQF
ncbi:MAG: TonB-dependent siderophore receptor [Acidobacteriota bacterium]